MRFVDGKACDVARNGQISKSIPCVSWRYHAYHCRSLYGALSSCGHPRAQRGTPSVSREDWASLAKRGDVDSLQVRAERSSVIQFVLRIDPKSTRRTSSKLKPRRGIDSPGGAIRESTS